jgi:hypothetical protein
MLLHVSFCCSVGVASNMQIQFGLQQTGEAALAQPLVNAQCSYDVGLTSRMAPVVLLLAV